MSQKLQQFLEAKIKLSPELFAKASTYAKTQKCSINLALEKLDLVKPETLLNCFAAFYGVRKTVLSKMTISAAIIDIISKPMAEGLKVIPLDKVGNNIIIAMLYPNNIETIDKIRFQTGYFAKPVFANESDLNSALTQYYSHKKVSIEKLSVKETSTKNERISIAEKKFDDGTIVTLVNQIIIQCLERGASDIHVEPYEDYIRVRLRIDGVLHEIVRPPLSAKAALISRIKIMSNMDIAETRVPQDGAINTEIGGKEIDFRVNTLPTVNSEKIVMRLLDKSNLQVDMSKLGFDEDQLSLFKENISRPHGMVLVTGPTGSGKTTTLYSALEELNNENNNIVTAEDPVEFAISGVNQVMMKSKIGLNFASSLRAFLRQDPDIIMVGEVRDLETAEIAMKAALTGHLVLSTLHTNSAIDTISRLLNMGIEPFNLVASLNLICAQRLVRTLCISCKEVDTQTTRMQLISVGVKENQIEKAKIYRSVGCPSCNNSGTKGRIGVHEVLFLNEEIKTAIVEQKSAIEIKKIAMRTGMRTLRQSAIQRMLEGICSIDDVVKVTDSDDLDKKNKTPAA